MEARLQTTPNDPSAEPKITDEPLRRDVRTLGYELGRVLKRHGSPQLYELVEQIRGLSKARRAGDASADTRLRQTIASLDLRQLNELIRALSCFFDLANLAEDRHRIRVLRQRERTLAPAPQSESIADAIQSLQHQGLSADQLQSLLDRLDVDLVFTAHPTEAKRRTVRNTLRRLRQDLLELDHRELLPRERHRLINRIQADLDCLWETDPLRPRRPTVLEEVGRSLFLAQSLWDIGPWLYRALRTGLERAYPGHRFQIPDFLRFSSWIGGDRDGNPFVTAEVTRQTLIRLRSTILEKHLHQCTQMHAQLSISDRDHPVAQPLLDALADAEQRWPQLEERLQKLNPHEKYRHWLSVIRYRLEQTATADPYQGLHDAAYGSSDELVHDLRLIVQSLRDNGHDTLADGDLQDWLDRLTIFGFHLARLDIREDARRLQEAVAELMARLGLHDDYASLDESARQQLLTTPPDAQQVRTLNRDTLSDTARETLELFVLLQRTADTFGSNTLGALIASMTHQPSDILTMFWLSRLGHALANTDQPLAALPIVPLFETIDDLKHAAKILEQLLAIPAYADHVRATGNMQICMIGYSDSTKDGGYLPANWQLYEAQRHLAQVTRQHGFDMMFFHGRGGALGRGGGPAARGVLSLPPDSVSGKLRMTEQGEVLAERYDDPEIAHRHLEQVTWATMLISAQPGDHLPEPWSRLMNQAADIAQQTYHDLINDPAFMPYFTQASPIDTIESMPIASRPARRKTTRQLQDLRAIPYTFAWTQNRHLITAFYGLGSGLQTAAGDNWAVLAEMYEHWPFFRAMIDNVELALAKHDPAIAENYASLVSDADHGQRILNKIRDEYTRTRDAVLKITGREELLAATPWLQRSIRVRNPYVDPLNFIQIELMRRLNRLQDQPADDPDANQQRESLRELLRLSVQGIAAGLRTTG